MGSVEDVGYLTEDIFDEIEFEAARSGDHASAALRMAELADTYPRTYAITRAEALTRSGEQWELAERPDQAAAVYRMAIEDGGETWLDARAFLVGPLLRMGSEPEARRIIADLGADRPANPKVYEWVAEALFDAGDMAEAEAWATDGARRLMAAIERSGREAMDVISPDPEYVDLQDLLRIRYRARVDLGRPEDDLDALAGFKTPPTT
jgi:hypothetical protein